MLLVNSILKKFFGTKSERDIKDIEPLVAQINKIYEQYHNLGNDDLREKSKGLKEKVRQAVAEDIKRINELKLKISDEDIQDQDAIYDEIDNIEKGIDKKYDAVLNEILPEAFSLIRETTKRFKESERVEVTATDYDRDLAAKCDFVDIKGNKAIYHNRWEAGGNVITWDMVHYDVQLIGGIVLHQGKIAEMATGEGKTVVATLPVFLNALTGRGVHIVTVNDYLAKRDAEWMGPIYQFHGLTVDCIDKHEPNSDNRRKAYNADITFGTNNEFGFDYLRDNMTMNVDELVQRSHNYAIVDEVDSVLIDDARTPLIISGPVPKGDNQEFDNYKPKVQQLINAQRNLVNQVLVDAKRLIKEGDTEKGGFYLLRAFKGLPKNKAIIKFLSEEGNKVLLQKTENFYMQENSKNMYKVTDELFFIIEEKQNSVELTDKGLDLITTTAEDPDFFILPDIGSKITELEHTITDNKELLKKKDELIKDYTIKSERVHTVHQLLKAYALFERDTEYVVIENKVKIVDEQTGRIMEGRRYSDGLHQAIEAKENVKVEAATQTMATITLQNYFRMYKKLAGMTGTAETEAGEFWNIYKLDVVVIPTNLPIIRDDREDMVYKTKREKYNAVIDEVVSLVKAGRPVLVGTTSVEISETLSRMLKIRKLNHNVLNAKLHQREADIVAEAGRTGTVTIATNMAGRGTDIKLTSDVKEAGGLAIIGTERHESRRVDRQLRGRSGRQGDPGSSQFYVSLEDDLMRLFGSDRIASLMDRLGLKEGEMIQHSMITKSIERAQKKVEENNFGIRKRLLEYDDVMNSQREVIYTRRRHALFGERIGTDIANMMLEVCESLVEEYHGSVEFNEFNYELLRLLSIEAPFNEQEFYKYDKKELISTLNQQLLETYKRRIETICQQAMPVIKEVFEKQSGIYENIVVPISDGSKVFNIVTNLEKAYKSESKDLVRSYEKTILLVIISEAWKEHLRELDDLRTAVQNASYEQKDPLLIYKFESFKLFETMLDIINKDVVGILMRGHIPIRDASGVQKAQHQRTDMSRMETSRHDSTLDSQQQRQQKVQPIRSEKKIGRNETVKVRYTDGRVVEAKYKKVEMDIEKGACVLTT